MPIDKPLGRRAIAYRVADVAACAEANAHELAESIGPQGAYRDRLTDGSVWLRERLPWIAEADDLVRLLERFVKDVDEEADFPHPQYVAEARALVKRCRRRRT